MNYKLILLEVLVRDAIVYLGVGYRKTIPNIKEHYDLLYTLLDECPNNTILTKDKLDMMYNLTFNTDYCSDFDWSKFDTEGYVKMYYTLDGYNYVSRIYKDLSILNSQQ